MEEKKEVTDNAKEEKEKERSKRKGSFRKI